MEVSMEKGRSKGDGRKKLKKVYTTYVRPVLMNRKSLLGLIILTGFFIMGIFGPLIVPLNMESDISKRFLPPSKEHILGTDYFGIDIFAQIVHGTWSVLVLAFLPSIFAILMAVSIGITAGYLKGIFGRVVNGIIDVFMTVPSFPAMLLMAAMFKSVNIVFAAFLMSIWMWAGPAKMIRARVYSIRSMEFVEAAELLEMPKPHIIFKEITPHLMPYIFMQFVNMIKYSVGASQGLMFLGLLKFNPCHWGAMLNIAVTQTGSIYLPFAIHYPLSIIFFIVLMLIGCTLLSYGVEEIFNPKLRTYE